MRTHTLIASSLLALALFAASEARAAGSFFVAELNQGLGVPLGFEEGYTPGYALGLSLGVGGKFSGNPIRFYLMGHFNTASFSADRVYNGRQRLIDREVTDLNLGLRLLFPVDGRNLRVFAELGLGSAQVDSAATSPELPGNIRLLDTDTDFALFTALGIQYRLAYWFSAGAKADFATIFDEDNIDVITRATSDEQGGQQVGRLNLYLTATLHF